MHQASQAGSSGAQLVGSVAQNPGSGVLHLGPLGHADDVIAQLLARTEQP